MKKLIANILSNDSNAFWQFVKYGVIGVLSTVIQMGVFYALAATVLQCLGPDDKAVIHLGLPSVEIPDALRSIRFGCATAVGFIFANTFCWLMNRRFVFKPGRFRWYVEFLMFFGVSAIATVLAIGLSGLAISRLGLMTTYAAIIEVIVSFFFNYFIRKFLIFKK